MLNRKRPGYFSGGCSDSKWGGSRKKFKWDLFQKMLPNQAAKFDEVPNWLKHRLGLDEIKAKGPKKELIPNELLAIADGILMEECTRGLEMDTKSVVSLFETLVDIYNEEAETYNKESQGKHVERLAELSESGKLTEDELEAIASKPPALVPVISKEWTEKRMQHTVERFCRQWGFSKHRQERPSKHLSREHYSMKKLGEYIQSLRDDSKVDPRLMFNWDQVWTCFSETLWSLLV